MLLRSIAILVLGAAASLCAQEVQFIDLTSVQQRVELRFPPAPLVDGVADSGFGGLTIGCGGADFRDPHALGVYLEGVSADGFDPAQPFDAEFKVLNTGRAPIELPVSPHLSDLQPYDPSEKFSYLSLALAVDVVEEPSLMGYVQLYGATDHEGTVMVLQPGEWIRVRAELKLEPREAPKQSPLPNTFRLRPGFWLRKNTFQPGPGGYSTQMNNLYPNETPTPSVTVQR